MSQTKLTSQLDAPAPAPGFKCGHAVALSEKFAVIGCPEFKKYDKSSGRYSGRSSGAFVVYDRGNLSSVPFKKEYDPMTEDSDHPEFSSALSINAAGKLVVGSRAGFVEIYELKSTQPGRPTLRLRPNLASKVDNFGMSVAINDDDVVAVGAVKQDGKGAVYLYRNLNTSPEEIPAPAAVSNCVSASGCQFGFSVALFQNTLFVGAPYSQQGGMVFVYDLTLVDYQAKVKRLPGNILDGSEYGRSVAVANGAVVVGSRGFKEKER